MPGAWLREEQADLAVDRILEAAAKAFGELGVSRTGMGQIAKYAGCSRGTLYRYFKSRHELHLAYIDRSARALSARLDSELGHIADPRARLIESVVHAVREVRNDPGMAAWFAPQESGRTARMSHGSEVIDALASSFVARMLDPTGQDPSSDRMAHWLVRVIVSLLTMPGASEEEERALVSDFVAPVLL